MLSYTAGMPPNADSVFRSSLPDLVLYRSNGATGLRRSLAPPAFIVVVQGAKDIIVGDQRYRQAAGEYMIMSVGMPVRVSIAEASDDVPYLALSLNIDLSVISELIHEIGHVEMVQAMRGSRFFSKPLDMRQAQCLERLADLLAMPDALRILYPSIAREVFYWLLAGPDGEQIRRLAVTGSHLRRVADAIVVMRTEYTEDIPIERLAGIARMSHSSFHMHFKALTAMSPLQYLKQMRLLEGRRLMLANGGTVADVAHRVGYQSSSQFSREYARLFGAPPHRDALGSRQKA